MPPTEKSPSCAAATTARTSSRFEAAARSFFIALGPRMGRKPAEDRLEENKTPRVATEPAAYSPRTLGSIAPSPSSPTSSRPRRKPYVETPPRANIAASDKYLVPAATQSMHLESMKSGKFSNRKPTAVSAPMPERERTSSGSYRAGGRRNDSSMVSKPLISITSVVSRLL